MKNLQKVLVGAGTALSFVLANSSKVLASSYISTTSDEGAGAFLGASLVSIICSLLIAIPLVGFWIWMLVDISKRHTTILPGKTKWIIAMLLLGTPVAIYYYFARKKKMDKMSK